MLKHAPCPFPYADCPALHADRLVLLLALALTLVVLLLVALPSLKEEDSDHVDEP